MYPSRSRIRAISIFTLEAGTSTRGWCASVALRIRVSMSAMGSVICSPEYAALPAALGHASDVAVERQLTEAETAQRELADIRAWASAAVAAIAVPHLELQLLVFSRDFRGRGH